MATITSKQTVGSSLSLDCNGTASNTNSTASTLTISTTNAAVNTSNLSTVSATKSGISPTNAASSTTNLTICTSSGVIGTTNGAISTTSTISGGRISSKRRLSLRKSENNSVHRWLEAMRESSPPRNRPTTHNDAFSKAMDLRQRAWIAKVPSALDTFDQIIETASGKRIAVFLDYDGTLSPIVEDPERAFMSDEMRAIVKEVANTFPTAIISGRCTEKIYEFVQLPELYYAGSHGMDIMGPREACNPSIVNGEETRASHEKGKEVVLFQPAKEFMLVISEVSKLLKEKTKNVLGAKVEQNKFCVTVHFRCVKEKNWVALAEQVHQVVQSYPNLRLTEGRKILEIRPLIAWNKGKALDFLLKALGLGDQNNVFPLYLGDDRSDEDAFKVLNRKKHGIGILVSSGAKETNAVCSLRDPSEVGELLKRLVNWKRRRLNKFPWDSLTC